MAGQGGSRWDPVVSSLLDARGDHATTRFDAELARAEAEGRIDAVTARTLRWWQRQTVRALEDHVRSVVPSVLDTLAAADVAAREGVAEAAAAWEQAQPAQPAQPSVATEPLAAAAGRHAVLDGSEAPDEGDVGTLGTVTPLTPRPDHPGPGFTSHLSPVGPAVPTVPTGPGAAAPRLLASGLTVLAGTTPRDDARPVPDARAARPEDR